MSEFIEWDTFYRKYFRWRQGEHVTCLGPTGSGKTTLLLKILDKRSYHLVFATKPKDPLISELKGNGYKVIRDMAHGLPDTDIHRKVILWPKIEVVGDVDEQRRVFRKAFETVYRDGGWCICLDEIRYQTDYLGLGKLVDLIFQQGRSLGISLAVGAQRPAWIPVSAYDQATHLFIWRYHSEADVRKLSALGSVDAREVIREIRNLPRHETLYVNTVTGKMLRTKVAL